MIYQSDKVGPVDVHARQIAGRESASQADASRPPANVQLKSINAGRSKLSFHPYPYHREYERRGNDQYRIRWLRKSASKKGKDETQATHPNGWIPALISSRSPSIEKRRTQSGIVSAQNELPWRNASKRFENDWEPAGWQRKPARRREKNQEKNAIAILSSRRDFIHQPGQKQPPKGNHNDR